jgi:TonB family protein
MKARNTKAHLRMIGVMGFAGVIMATRATGAGAQDQAPAGQQAPASGARPTTVHFISAGSMPPTHPGGMDLTYASQHQPKYPPEAIGAGHSGTVLVMVQIGLDGRVISTKIERSSGYPELDESASAAVSGWRFYPGYKNGSPQASWARVPVNFPPQKNIPNATAQSTATDLKQGGMINDELPMPYKTATEALVAIPKDANYVRREDRRGVPTPGITTYVETSNGRASWWVFDSTSKFYPAVVRRRVYHMGTYSEIRTSILCDASKKICEEIHQGIDKIDHYCGFRLPECKH